MTKRMQDFPWEVSEETIGKMFPELKPEQRAEAAGNYSRYLQVVAKIYDDLEDEGKLKDVILRLQWEKRNHNKRGSQNVNYMDDDADDPKGEAIKSDA